MKRIKHFAQDYPENVHEKVLNTLDTLPNRHKETRSRPFTIAVTVALVAVLLFSSAWTFNPVLAQGNTFREAVAIFLSINPSAQEIIEDPLPAPNIAQLEENVMPSETAALTAPEEQEVQVPTVMAKGYIFELEEQTLYDGEVLVTGYNVRRADGSPMPTEEEFTEYHLAGFIRARDFNINGEVTGHFDTSFDWSDPYVYRQVCSVPLKDLKKPITEDTKIIMRVAVYEYGPIGFDTITTFAELPFSVNTSHEEHANRDIPVETVFYRGDFTVEIESIINSAVSTEITVIAYKDDDPEFGKRMDGYMGISVRNMEGELLPFLTGSMGCRTEDDGSTCLENEWIYDPTFEFPDQFQLTFRCGDLNSGEEVSYEPIVVELQ